MIAPSAAKRLSIVLPIWQQLLSSWARDGLLEIAAQQALNLDEQPELLRQLIHQWSAADLSALPAIALLSASDSQGALGAYAAGTGTIYLNAAWLTLASITELCAVLTEELGHHLDALLNETDSPGDEGEIFSRLLSRSITTGQLMALRQQNDSGSIRVGTQTLPVEQAAAGTLVSRPIAATHPGRSPQEFKNPMAFAVLRRDGSVISWGHPDYGGDSSGVDFDGPDDNLTVQQIFSNNSAFAALRSDGSVVSWGISDYGGNSTGVDFDGPSDDLTIRQIFSGTADFVALRSDGSAVSWGYYTSIAADNSTPLILNGRTIRQVVSGETAFAALCSDGSVVSWGSNNYGGDSTGVDFDGPSNNLSVSQLFANRYAFAALRNDGTVVTWGSQIHGGHSTDVDFDGDNNDLRVERIFDGGISFAALRSDGSIVTWGSPDGGGNSYGVDFDGPNNNLRVTQISSTGSAFAALRSDGSVITWGSSRYSYGANNSTDVDFDGPDNNLRVLQIFANSYAFTALRNDGSVVSWGDSRYGGSSADVDFDGPNNNLTVQEIVAGDYAFAALRSDGSVVSWGQYGDGGNSSHIDFNGLNDDLRVSQIFSTSAAFAALRSDGSVVTWGASGYGGTSSAVASQLTNVVAFADPSTDDRLLFPPTALNTSTTSFNENIPAGSRIASLSSSDPDAGERFTYSLVSGAGDSDNAAFSIDGDQLAINAAPDFESKSSYSIRLRSTDGAGLSTEQALTLTVNDLQETPNTARILSLPAHSALRSGAILEVPITINDALDLESLDLRITFDADRLEAPTSGALIRGGTANSDWAFTTNIDHQSNHILLSAYGLTPLPAGPATLAYLRLQLKADAPAGTANLSLANASLNERAIAVMLEDTPISLSDASLSIATDLQVRAGGDVVVPINIDSAADIQSFDLVVSFDASKLTIPATAAELISSGSATDGWAFQVSTLGPDLLRIQGSGSIPLSASATTLVNLNLLALPGIGTGRSTIDLVSASLNQNSVPARLMDGTLLFSPSTFHIMAERKTASGIALRLSDAPDLSRLNLYDGSDQAVESSDIRISRGDGKAISNLSVHWQADSSELFIIRTDSLTGLSTSPHRSDLWQPDPVTADYSIEIDSRGDGLIAANAQPLDGNGDGTAGDAYRYRFSYAPPSHSIAMADTARGPGQALTLNGEASKAGIDGLPILISSNENLNQLSGSIRFDARVLEQSNLGRGRDLPADWELRITISSAGTLDYSATGGTAISGRDLELLRFSARVAHDAAYGSTSLIQATVRADQRPDVSFETDPGLILFAYPGDTTGDGTLSSLDASRVQRVVVGLDPGFDAYPRTAPNLIGDLTGNGTLSSLDATAIQRRIVGLDALTFPAPPALPF